MEDLINIKSLKELFKLSADVIFQKYNFNGHKVYFIICDAMVNEQLLNGVVITKVQSLLCSLSEIKEVNIKNDLHLPYIQKVDNVTNAITLVYTGHVLLYFEKEKILFSSKISKKPNRIPEETLMESVLKGPRDNFIEDITVNIALIRKRLPTNSFSVENLIIGRRSKTTVSMLYIDDVVNKEIVNSIKIDLKKIDTDIVFSGDVLMGEMGKGSKILPKHDYTGRPDYAVQALIRGRVIMLVDGVPYAIIVPTNWTLLLKTSEDSEYPIIVSSISRLLRLVSIMVSIFLPGFWLALTIYHQEQIPINLLVTLVKLRTGNILPVGLEIILMLIIFELIREANLHLPIIIGETLSIVGGLIIGSAAIKIGLTTPPMLVIIAVSSIAASTLVNQSFVKVISAFRLFVVVASSILGLVGFIISMFFIVLYFANFRLYGFPYFNVGTDLSWNNLKRSFLLLSSKGYSKRPEFLKPQDRTRTYVKYKKS